MFNPASFSPAPHAPVFHLSPSLHRQSNPVREDSSVEPRALHGARWPSSRPHRTSSPSRRLPRSFTVPASSFSSVNQEALSFDSESSSPRNDPKPVVLSPGLTPSMRDALPQPKALRPQPPPFQSDLSAASTRAENEPLAVRDLRRVTAPPTLMDPWQYDRNRNRERERERDARKRFIKSMSTTTVVKKRADTSRDQFTALADHRPWRLSNRSGHGDRKFPRRRWFSRTDVPVPRIPDRFYDSFEYRYDTHSQEESSVISALTGESDPLEENVGMRWRAQSEMGPRRSSFLLGKEKVMSFWGRLRRRRRAAHRNRQRTSNRPSTPPRAEKRTTIDRKRRAKFPLFWPMDVGVASRYDR